MDSTTLFLAQLVGPVMLLVGLGILVSKNYYMRAYKDLENETLAVVTTGVIALVVGIVMVQSHNRWDGFISGFISLIGWLSIVKGGLLIVLPRWVDKIGDYISHTNWFPAIGSAYAVIGAYISYIAFLA